jgi:hypothetical protein
LSWSFFSNCYGCKRQPECPDEKKIRAAIDAIHFDPEHCEKGGSGSIQLSCCKMDKKEEF